MSIINSFDQSKSLIDLEKIYGKKKSIVESAVVTFSKAVLDMFLKNYESEIIAYSSTSNGPIPLYLFTYESKKYLFYMSPTGAAISSQTMCEVSHLTGVKNFIFFGSCGILDSKKCKGSLIVPNSSYRDEGTSYHFMKPTDFIDIKNYLKVAKIFEKFNLPYVIGKSWTTDSILMETENKVALRKKEGCICVEMESSGLQAVANYYNFELYIFFFGADLLDNNSWSLSNLSKEEEPNLQRETFNVALKILKEI